MSSLAAEFLLQSIHMKRAVLYIWKEPCFTYGKNSISPAYCRDMSRQCRTEVRAVCIYVTTLLQKRPADCKDWFSNDHTDLCRGLLWTKRDLCRCCVRKISRRQFCRGSVRQMSECPKESVRTTNICRAEQHIERWGAGVKTQKMVRGEIGGWGRVPFNETYAPSLSTIYDGA